MWIWRGAIVPEPGEDIRHAAMEAVALCQQFKAGNDGQTYGGYPSQGYFQFEFNDVTLIVWKDSTPEQIVAQFYKAIGRT